MLPLHGVVQHYAWGGNRYIPQLLGLPEAGDKPCAELWLGAHPSASSEVEIEVGRRSLRDWIAADREGQLGPDVVRRFAGELPFLFKVLDARDMLSIQVHPDRRQAEAGFEREEHEGIPLDAKHRNYRDRNPKPEVHVALTPFWMLHGFRPLEEVAMESKRHPELEHAWPELESRLAGCIDTSARGRLLQEVYDRVMRMPQGEVDAILNPILERAGAAPVTDRSDPMFWVCRAAETFARADGSRDRGLFSIWLLNLVVMESGQSTFQDAGVPHAYLEGVTVELMAGSDNVLRGGLTPKHVDVDELLRVVRFVEERPVVSGGMTTAAGERVYPTTAAEFELSRLHLTPGEEREWKSEPGPECLLVMEGEVLASAGGTGQAYGRGKSLWVPWNTRCKLCVKGTEPAVVYRAGMPAPSTGS
ncbi:MAG: mannose-6-phosphate isomerase, class [Verrucomicrobiota bacterium]|jgi:mannose-6-phosphate isomerase